MTIPREALTTGLALFTDRLLRTIIDTECQKANMAAHDTILQANKHLLTGWFWTTEDDDRVCILCLGLSENYYTLDEPHPPLPLHDLCRCWPRPDGPTWRDLGVDVDEWGEVERPIHFEDEGVRFAKGGIKEGFKDLPEKLQVEMIGPVRFEMLKEGKITLSDLVDKTTGELILVQDLNNA